MKQFHPKIFSTPFFIIFCFTMLVSCGSPSKVEISTTETARAISTQDTGGIIAEGEVIPERHAELAFAMSGVVEEVFFEEGQPVKKGEVIARLEGIEHLETAAAAAEVELLSAQQAVDDMYRDARVRKTNAQLALAKAETAFDDAQDDLEKIDWRYGNQNAIDEAHAAYIIAQKKVEDAEKQFDDVSFRTEDDELRAARLSVLAAARAERDRALTNWEYVQSEPDQFEVAEAQSRVEVARSALEAAERDWERLKKDGIDPDDQALAETRLKNAEIALAAARADLSDVELKAPFDGTLVSIDIRQSEFVSPGSATATIADLSGWQVETTDLTEINVTGIRQGMNAEITFEAVPGLALSGKVARIKALGENQQGDITYTILIDLDEMDERLLWNMSAEVEFIR